VSLLSAIFKTFASPMNVYSDIHSRSAHKRTEPFACSWLISTNVYDNPQYSAAKLKAQFKGCLYCPRFFFSPPKPVR